MVCLILVSLVTMTRLPEALLEVVGKKSVKDRIHGRVGVLKTV